MPLVLVLEGTINSFEPYPHHSMLSRTSWLFLFQTAKPQPCKAGGAWLTEKEEEEWESSAQVTPLMGTFLKGQETL